MSSHSLSIDPGLPNLISSETVSSPSSCSSQHLGPFLFPSLFLRFHPNQWQEIVLSEPILLSADHLRPDLIVAAAHHCVHPSHPRLPGPRSSRHPIRHPPLTCDLALSDAKRISPSLLEPNKQCPPPSSSRPSSALQAIPAFDCCLAPSGPGQLPCQSPPRLLTFVPRPLTATPPALPPLNPQVQVPSQLGSVTSHPLPLQDPSLQEMLCSTSPPPLRRSSQMSLPSSTDSLEPVPRDRSSFFFEAPLPSPFLPTIQPAFLPLELLLASLRRLQESLACLSDSCSDSTKSDCSSTSSD